MQEISTPGVLSTMVKSTGVAEPSRNGCGWPKRGMLMPRRERWTLILLGLALLVSVSSAETVTPAQTVSPGQTKHHRKSHKAAPKPAVLPPLPQGPLPQLPLDLMPATPARVSYQNGLLTIVAQNSTLSEILRDVHKLTGASIEVPPNATERVVTRLGPGPPRDVLASLLNGSSFNYVMVGSSSNPTSVVSVVLTAKPSTGTGQTATSTSQPPQPVYGAQMPAPQPVIAQQQVVAQPAGADGDDPNAEDPGTAAAEENAEDQTDVQQPAANGAAQQDPAQPQPNAGPKTPEQILEMLRRQQPMSGGQPGVPPSTQQPPQN
jgi:hypothetical protein